MILKELKTILDAWKFVEKLKNDNNKKVKKNYIPLFLCISKNIHFCFFFVITAILNGCMLPKTRVQFQKKDSNEQL